MVNEFPGLEEPIPLEEETSMHDIPVNDLMDVIEQTPEGAILATSQVLNSLGIRTMEQAIPAPVSSPQGTKRDGGDERNDSRSSKRVNLTQTAEKVPTISNTQVPCPNEADRMAAKLNAAAFYELEISNATGVGADMIIQSLCELAAYAIDYWNFESSEGIATLIIKDRPLASYLFIGKALPLMDGSFLPVLVKPRQEIPLPKLTGETLDMINGILSRCYYQDRTALDLSDFGEHEELIHHFLPLEKDMVANCVVNLCGPNLEDITELSLSGNRLNCLSGFRALKTLAPELRSIHLDQTKIWCVELLHFVADPAKLQEVSLIGSPLMLSRSFEDLVRDIQDQFPLVTRINGHQVFGRNVLRQPEEYGKAILESYKELPRTPDGWNQLYADEVALSLIMEAESERNDVEPETVSGKQNVIGRLSKLPHWNPVSFKVDVIKVAPKHITAKLIMTVEEDSSNGIITRNIVKTWILIPLDSPSTAIIRETLSIGEGILQDSEDEEL